MDTNNNEKRTEEENEMAWYECNVKHWDKKWDLADYIKAFVVCYCSMMFGPIAVNLVNPFKLWGRKAATMVVIIRSIWDLIIGVLAVAVLLAGIVGIDLKIETSKVNDSVGVETGSDSGSVSEVLGYGKVTNGSVADIEEIDTLELFRRFNNNKIELDNSLGDRSIRLSGAVRNFEIDGGNYKLLVGNNKDQVICNFDKQTADALSELSVGDSIEIVGVLRVTNEELRLTDCKLVTNDVEEPAVNEKDK